MASCLIPGSTCRTITAEAEEAGARRRSNQFAGRSTLDLQALEQGWSQVPQNPQVGLTSLLYPEHDPLGP